jgi:cell division protein FtsL
MKDFFNGIGSMFSWIFKRLPSKPESARLERARLQREWDELIKKEASSKNINRLDAISKRLRELYEQALARD